MEFTQYFKKALELGISKENAISAWKIMSQLKGRPEENVPDTNSQISACQISDDRGAKDDQLARQLQGVKEELKCYFNMKLQELFDYLMEKQETQWQKVNNKNSQIEKMFQEHLDTLSKNVSSTVELQESSLKQYIQQHFDVFEERFERIIQGSNAGYTPDAVYLGVSHQEPEVVHPQDIHNRHSMTKQKHSTSLHGHENNQETNDDKNMPNSTLFWGVEDANTFVNSGLDINSSNNDKPGHQIRGIKSELREEAYVEYTHEEKAGKDDWGSWNDEWEQEPDTNVSSDLSQSVTSLTEESTVATGIFAEAISGQLKPNHNLLDANTNKMSDSLRNSMGRKAMNSIIYASNNPIIPISNASHKCSNEFTIHNVVNLDKSGTQYFSPFILPKTGSWKAQLGISFNKTHQLKVQILISQRVINSDSKWPLHFSGAGYIFQKNSKRFTEIWQIVDKKCEKPSSKGEISFSPDICLATKRGSYADVTYHQLQSRHYAEDNQFIFGWNLSAR